MANIKDQIEGLQAIITMNLPITIACWMAIQQAQTLEEKNRAGYTLFKLMVRLPIDHPTSLLIPYRKNGLPHLRIFSDVRQPMEHFHQYTPVPAVHQQCLGEGQEYHTETNTDDPVSATLTFMGGTWSVWLKTIQCAS